MRSERGVVLPSHCAGDEVRDIRISASWYAGLGLVFGSCSPALQYILVRFEDGCSTIGALDGAKVVGLADVL